MVGLGELLLLLVTDDDTDVEKEESGEFPTDHGSPPNKLKRSEVFFVPCSVAHTAMSAGSVINPVIKPVLPVFFGGMAVSKKGKVW